MIPYVTIRPEPQNKKARYVFYACLGSAILLMAIYMLLPKYKGVVGIVALLFITAAIYVYNRYVCAVYYYDIIPGSDGDAVFLIRQLVGKRETTLCRVDLSSIISVKSLTREQRREYKPERDVSRYAYAPTLSPEVIYLLEVRSSYEKADVFIELTEEQAGMMSDYVRMSRENVE